ncbi:MAG TPA: dihydrofolate reductase family protein [Ktedonobacteraceae bacterium]|nr:dihydrofolate reductase family protein [Ktedonobacteraceae bacterium]
MDTSIQRLTPLTTLFEGAQGEELPLTGELARLLAPVRLNSATASTYVLGNFVSTLDGVVALNVTGHMSGGDISGFNIYDQAMVGLLRAAADAVIVGASTFRVEATHLLTPTDIAPAFATEYSQLRARLGKAGAPCNVIVTARGDLNLSLPLFQQSKVPVLIVTTAQGLQHLQRQSWPASIQVQAVRESGRIGAEAILHAVSQATQGKLLLVEGGPHLMSTFMDEQRLDELFLTLAPQIAGRDGALERPGLVAGQLFAPEHERWGKLVGVRQAANHLFLRYKFER